jgi:O-acetyl-ADP-ribose deacetylase (regulator of RNase III)
MLNNIKIVRGNIFSSPAQTLVNTINCKGVMGAGIALEFKYRYPKMFQSYQNLCKRGDMEIGKLWLYDQAPTQKKVLNFPTKYDWRNESKMEYLERGLDTFLDTYEEDGITSIAFPLLGADKGGLNPQKVQNLMLDYLGGCDIPIEIYEYDPLAADDLIETFAQAFENTDFELLSQRLGVSLPILEKIARLLDTQKLPSLIQLTKMRELSETTIAGCFQLAITAKI